MNFQDAVRLEDILSRNLAGRDVDHDCLELISEHVGKLFLRPEIEATFFLILFKDSQLTAIAAVEGHSFVECSTEIPQ